MPMPIVRVPKPRCSVSNRRTFRLLCRLVLFRAVCLSARLSYRPDKLEHGNAAQDAKPGAEVEAIR